MIKTRTEIEISIEGLSKKIYLIYGYLTNLKFTS